MSNKTYYMQNVTRTITVAFTIGFTLMLGQRLDSFLGVLGALTCSPIGFTFPALIHYYVFKNTLTTSG